MCVPDPMQLTHFHTLSLQLAASVDAVLVSQGHEEVAACLGVLHDELRAAANEVRQPCGKADVLMRLMFWSLLQCIGRMCELLCTAQFMWQCYCCCP